MEKIYTEEDLRQAFYKGREQDRTRNGDVFFIRATFNGYLRELDGQEDPYAEAKKRIESAGECNCEEHPSEAGWNFQQPHHCSNCGKDL